MTKSSSRADRSHWLLYTRTYRIRLLRRNKALLRLMQTSNFFEEKRTRLSSGTISENGWQLHSLISQPIKRKNQLQFYKFRLSRLLNRELEAAENRKDFCPLPSTEGWKLQLSVPFSHAQYCFITLVYNKPDLLFSCDSFGKLKVTVLLNCSSTKLSHLAISFKTDLKQHNGTIWFAVPEALVPLQVFYTFDTAGSEITRLYCTSSVAINYRQLP